MIFHKNISKRCLLHLINSLIVNVTYSVANVYVPFVMSCHNNNITLSGIFSQKFLYLNFADYMGMSHFFRGGELEKKTSLLYALEPYMSPDF